MAESRDELSDTSIDPMTQLPVKAHYAALAMLALAKRWESRALAAAKVIAKEESIPTQFLLQILQQLRSAGLIDSTRGANGGFMLSRSPSQINLAQIVDAVCSAACSGADDASSPHSRVLQKVWQELAQKQRAVLEEATLARLLECVGETQVMFYI